MKNNAPDIEDIIKQIETQKSNSSTKGKNLKKVGEFITARFDVAQEVAEILINNGFHVTKYKREDWYGSSTPVEVYTDNQ